MATKPGSRQVNIYEAKSHLSQLVKEAAAGAEIIIAKAGQPMARLVSMASEPRAERKPGRLKGQVWMADDFDESSPEVIALFYGDDEDSGGEA